MRSKLYIVFLGLSLILSNFCLAQLPGNCSGTKVRLAIAGDSWAQFMADDGTHNSTLKMYGQGDKVAVSETFELCVGCTGTPGANDYAVSGSEARQWANEAQYDYLQNLIDALNANPTIDWVVLSIGGNDILAARSGGGWYKNMNLDVPGSEAALFNTVVANTNYIMNQVWARARPNINFMISGYDFPNFNVTSFCSAYACPKRQDLSRDTNGNGSIDPSELITDAEITSMMQTVETIRQSMAASNPKVYYDNGMGLMHYFYGYDDGLYPSIIPGSTAYPLGAAPFTAGGNPNTPTDRDNFRPVGLFGLIGWFGADPIHLDEEAYRYKIKNQFDNILFEKYRGQPNETFWSNGAEDGYVDVLTNTVSSNGIRVGDKDVGFFGLDNEYRGILSFNTASLPNNVTITGASIYMFRSSVDDNPFLHTDRHPVLDVKNGFFGSSIDLEAVDGTAAASASNIGCFHGVADENKYAIRIDIGSTGLAQVNKTGTTQFRVSFDYADWSTELINFYDGSGIAAKPDKNDLEAEPSFYDYRVTRRTNLTDSTFTEVELNRGKRITPKEGFISYEKLVSAVPDSNGTFLVTYKAIVALEHAGLSRHMSSSYSAPANGLAPFLDVTYSLSLPLELTNFQAIKKDEHVALHWTSSNEKNVKGFYLEYTADGKQWNDLTFSPAENTITANNYSYQHNAPQLGRNYYRLRIEDLDGATSFSDIREVEIKGTQTQLKVYPNPFQDRLVLEFDKGINAKAKATLLDARGQIVYESTLEMLDNQQIYILSGFENLNQGVYFLRVDCETSVWVQRVLR